MKEPAFIPSTEALSTVPRDLQFHPSVVGGQQTLTPVQLETFNREGYLVWLLCLVAACGASLAWGLKRRQFAFVAYAAVYGVIPPFNR